MFVLTDSAKKAELQPLMKLAGARSTTTTRFSRVAALDPEIIHNEWTALRYSFFDSFDTPF